MTASEHASSSCLLGDATCDASDPIHSRRKRSNVSSALPASPSVGLSQPWRFVIVDDPARRRAIAEVFQACNAEALSSYQRRLGDRYANLKLAGIREAPAQLTVFADRGTGVGHGLGRRTIPEMIEYSVVTAVHTMWLAARAEGIGFGWVSILDPARMAEILDVPPDWHLIGHLCLGYPETETEIPELDRAGRNPPGRPIDRSAGLIAPSRVVINAVGRVGDHKVRRDATEHTRSFGFADLRKAVECQMRQIDLRSVGQR